MWPNAFLETVRQDVRYAARTLGHSRGFAAAAVVSLALGIGANIAIFSLINRLMLSDLPVQDPENLVELLQKYPGEPRGNGYWSWRSFDHFRQNSRSLAALIGFSPAHLTLRGDDILPESIDGEFVTDDYFSVLGVKPVVGRLPQSSDQRSDEGGATAVISWSFWKDKFSLDAAIVGRQVAVQNFPVKIIGVLPPKFSGLTNWSKPKLWLPIVWQPDIQGTAQDRLGMALIGRLKPGVSIGQARAEMSTLYRFTIDERASKSKDPLIHQMRAEVEPAGRGLSLLRDQVSQPLLTLMCLVGLMLLLACTNLASLLLARGAGRQRELALRLSLGATRLRILRQFLTEALLLSGLGSLAGLLIGYFGANALVRIMASRRLNPSLPPEVDIGLRVDLHVLLFTLALAFLTGLLFGAAPLFRAGKGDTLSSLRDGGSAANTRSRTLLGKTLVVAQVALSVFLLSAAGLFVGRLINLERVDLGFQRDHLLLLKLNAAGSLYKGEQLNRAYKELLDRLRAVPGVRSAAICAGSPLSGAGASRFANVEGHPERPQDRRYLAINWVSPGYFATLQTPFLAGREFRTTDEGYSPRVAIVSHAFAQHYFGQDSALGRHITFDGDSQPFQIIGVVGDSKYYEVEEPPLRTVYLNAFQQRDAASQIVLRTAINPMRLVPELRRVVGKQLKAVPIAHATTMTEQVDASLVKERILAALSGVFGGLAAALVGVGVYGLLAYTVARRTSEIGVRMALGAMQGQVMQAVLTDAVLLVIGGLVVGVPLALGAGTVLAASLGLMPKMNAGPFVIGPAVMIVIAVLAAWLPARRASRVDPITALRHE